MEKDSLSKEELRNGLKFVKLGRIEIPEHRGAMCYITAVPTVEYTCESCGKKVKEEGYSLGESEYEVIKDIVTLIPQRLI